MSANTTLYLVIFGCNGHESHRVESAWTDPDDAQYAVDNHPQTLAGICPGCCRPRIEPTTLNYTPEPRSGRPPRMTYAPWRVSQIVELGATDQNQWYWRCCDTTCRRWAGPHRNALQAKQNGMEHQYMHDRIALNARRTVTNMVD